MFSNPSGLQHVFGIYLERYSQYKNQNFVVMRGEEDWKRCFWVGKVMLLFRLRTASSGIACKEEEVFSNVQFMEVKTRFQVWTRHWDASVYDGLLGTSLNGLWILPAGPIWKTFMRVSTTALSLSEQLYAPFRFFVRSQHHFFSQFTVSASTDFAPQRDYKLTGILIAQRAVLGFSKLKFANTTLCDCSLHLAVPKRTVSSLS